MTTTTDPQALEAEILSEIATHKICAFTKGSKAMPRCGFTMQLKQFFDNLGYPYEFVDVLENMEKRDKLSQMTNWPTLPKVFIGGKLYGDTGILDVMLANGDLETLLKATFDGEAPAQS